MGRFYNFHRNTLKKCTQHNHIKGIQRHGKNQRPHRIPESQQLGVHHIAGNQPPVEKHGEKQQKRKYFTITVIRAGEHIRKHRGHSQAEQRSNNRNKYGNSIRTDNLIPQTQEKAIGVQAQLRREKRVAILENTLFTAEGDYHNQKHRKHTQQGKYRQNAKHHHIGLFADSVDSFFFMIYNR